VVEVLNLISDSVDALREVMKVMGGPKTIIVRGSQRKNTGLATTKGIFIIPGRILSPICTPDPSPGERVRPSEYRVTKKSVPR